MKMQNIPTPCYVVEESLLIKNLEILKSVMDQTGCHILLAQKCFSMFSVYPLLGKYLSGTTASGLFEAKLGKEYMGRENHIYSAAYREEEMDEIMEICDHIIFNSFSQWEKYKEKAIASGKEYGLRINPQCSTQEGHAIYDPCAPFSRMGITIDHFIGKSLEGISGLHFHTLCEQNSDDLVKTLESVEEQFGEYLHQMKWLNFGGGHHITREDYDLETLIACIKRIQAKYNLIIYLEPGEAVALKAGFLVSTVLDVIHNGMDIAILDTSAACHMPDVLEMPYRPEIVGAMMPGEKEYNYRLGGPTCLAGDIIGDYSFSTKLQVGDRLVFCDMAIYSMVKNNTFNGMNLPGIALKREDEIIIVKTFGYEDFKNRLS
ncbi:MAG: carboxynorspermidine decarboxylase [Lachnospiraceae bacterium]|nr:carboxynorspermidine decarboxylase [Lachnospiraceae bacterium]